MHRLLLLLAVAAALPAQDRWIEFDSGPFQIVTNAGEQAGRDRRAYLEQFRYCLGQVLGVADLRPRQTVRLMVLRAAKDTGNSLSLAGDAWTGSIAADGPVPRAVLRQLARVLIHAAPGQLPQSFEIGLAAIFSTMETRGSRIILGAPPPPNERDRDWARMHMLVVPENNFGKLCVLVHNLLSGVEQEPSYRNAYGKSPAEIDKEAEVYFRAGAYGTTSVSGRPIRAEKDFAAKPVETATARAMLADAGRTWGAAEEAALTPAKKPASPQSAEVSRREAAAEERKREAEQKQRDLERVKAEWEASVQAAIDKARKEQQAVPPKGKVEPWWDGPSPKGKVQGTLRQVDCLGKQARLIIEADDKNEIRLLVVDPSQIAVIGGGTAAFGCGVQKPQRRVVVEYYPKPDAKLGTAGEAAVIEFP